MTRPSVYVTILRTLVGCGFVIGSAVHLRAALTDTSAYAAFGDTALPPLDRLWTSFVMPNIVWLALCMAAFELAVGITAWLPGRWNRLSVIAITAFFAFLLFLGYAFPTASLAADFLANRLGTIFMLALILPWLRRPQRLSVPASWTALVRRSGHKTGSRRSTRLGRVRRRVVVTLEIVIAISAFGGGIAMLADPTGAMGMDPTMLDRLPVDSWLLPGVALIICNGLLPSTAAVAELRRQSWPRRFGHALAGAVVLAWPVTETLIYGYPLAGEPVWLRPAVAAVGLALIGLGLSLRHLDTGHSESTPVARHLPIPVGHGHGSDADREQP